jgi:death on curing protein
MIFITLEEAIEMHDRSIELYGGSDGMRDQPALESAMVAAENRSYYEGADLATCAATYAYHVTKAHAFIDGNKRTGAAVTLLFIKANDATIKATEDELYQFFLAIASGDLTREEAEEKIRQWINF